VIKYDICDGFLCGEIEAQSDEDAVAEARKWLALAVADGEAFDCEWELAEGEEDELTAHFCRLEPDDGEIAGEVTVKVRKVGGRVVVVE
jgi:hypothetical protein